MGKGGGGSPQPTSTTAYQTNLPEYAKPYVMNMLGAAQNQLFTTSPGTTTTNPDGTTTNTPGEITGFKPYTPYSTDPTKYFAGPTGLQQGVYGEAARMQTPGQFGQATGLAGMSGMGQLGTTGQAGMYGQQGSMFGGLGTALGAAGAMQAMPAFSAGQQFASQVTDPRSMQSYMSPYQQAVTDVAKNAAIREAQMMEQGNRLSAARQGTYGGARQALASLERERNLASNLSNIQAQGSQAAFDKAMQAQQFGANLGLQGIQTGLQGIGQGLAGTAQGMQGAGLGLQGVGAQQAGFAGAGQAASTLGQLGGAQQQADLARMGFQQQTGQQQQAYQQNIINQAIQDFATAQQYPYMQLSTMSNLLRGLPMQSMSTQQYQAQPSTTQQLLGLAGTGASLYGAMGRKEGGTIKEYAAGGGVRASLENKIDDIAETGGAKGLQGLLAQTKSPQAKQMIIDRMREEGITAAPSGLGRNMAGGGIIAFAEGDLVDDPLAAFSGITPEAMAADQLRIDEEKRKKEVQQYNFLKDASPVAAARMLANNPSLEPKAAPAAAPAAASTTTTPPAAAPAAAAPATAAAEYNSPTGLAAVLAERRKLLGIDGPGEKSEAFMKAMEERQAGMGKEREADRYLRMAESFAKFGSTAGPIGKVASEALGGFAKGEAAARKEEDKMKLEGMKMQADLEKARRAEERGDLDAAEKFYGSAEDRKNRLEASKIAASASGQTAQLDRDAIAQVMKDNPGMSYLEALQAVRGAGRAETTTLQNQKAVLASLDAQILTAKKEEKAALMRKRDEIYNQMLRTSSGSGAPGKVIDFNAIK
jgi:hypothetical protein